MCVHGGYSGALIKFSKKQRTYGPPCRRPLRLLILLKQLVQTKVCVNVNACACYKGVSMRLHILMFTRIHMYQFSWTIINVRTFV